ncbi:MAG: DUF5615 family PIN-like protein [Desulfobacterales bacterium]|nr:DUF5615 family PIN-like protein [Desulfobacterales bacterium]
MKFLADMGISPKTIFFLRDLGYEALHLHEEGLNRMADPAIMEKARNEGMVLLTHDLDFGDLVAASGARLPSVVVFRLRNMRPENVNRYLKRVLAEQERSLADGAIISITEGKFRVRPLPFNARFSSWHQ